MKKLSKIVLRSEHKVLNAQEMKGVVGGQIVLELCNIVSGSGVLNPDGSYTDDVVCGGACPDVDLTGSKPKQVCQKKKVFISVGKMPMISCVCQ